MNLITRLLHRTRRVTLLSSLLFVATNAFSDDTDILNAEKPPAPANVLFVFDNSGSMAKELTSENIPADPANSRLGVLRSALSEALDIIDNHPEIDDINIGIMNFSGHTSSPYTWLAHGPSYPVVSIKDTAQTILNSNGLFSHSGNSYLPVVATPATDTTKDYLKNIANQWAPDGKTPLVDALYEATRYYRGEELHWGKQPPLNKRSAHPSTYTGLISANSTSSTEWKCETEPCGGTTGVACNTSMNPSSCLTRTEVTHNCHLPSESACLAANPTWNSCSLKSGTSCTNTCPDGIYNESGCVNPVNTCSPYSYYRCTETTPPVTTCQHEVCGNVTTTTNSVGGSGTYNSPITKRCQSSSIIMLSDGQATINNSSGDIQTYIGSAGCDATSDSNESCGVDLAKFLANTDHKPDDPTDPESEGEHIIKVHTIGLALAGTTGTGHSTDINPGDDSATVFLKKLAKEGKGEYASANNKQALIEALVDSASDGSNTARSFSSPSYSIDPSSILSHGNAVYVPMFKAENSSVWSGNLKKFTLNKDGQLMDSGTPSAPATDASGTLSQTAKDAWTKATATVENAVLDGGAANMLDPDSRNIYVDYGSSMRALDTSYPGIKAALGDGSMSNAHRDSLLSFIRGKNSDGTARHHMGDIIHSKPVHLGYSGGKGYVFVGTNEGYLHIFDESNGQEVSAFMPSELLKNIAPQYESIVNNVDSKHLYGVDGEITIAHDDDGNRIVDGSEKVILYFGLRRGGTSYYALDVTTPANPKLVWKINSSTSTQFSKLAHTWSKPVIAKLKHGYPSASMKDVVIFGGGYSDDASGNEVNNKGSAVYIVDAETGTFIWSTDIAGSGKINNSIPAKIRVLDIDRNGSVDRLYFADTGGYIWRVDLNVGDLDGSGQSGNINKAKLTKFADLGATSSASSRKFFVEPDVAVFKYNGQYVLSLAIGSGDRPNPLDVAGDDQFFALFDENVFNLPSTDANIKKSELFDVTNTKVPSTVDLISPSRSYKGWHMDFPASSGLLGEKVLSTALTFQNKVFFTSFATGASTATSNSCEAASPNVSRLYALNLLNGGVALDLDGDGTINNNSDRSILVATGEITDTPQIVFKKPQTKSGNNCTTADCIRPFDIRVGKAVVGFADNQTVSSQTIDAKLPKVYWIDKDQQK